MPFKKKVFAPDDSTDTGVSGVVPDLVFIAQDYSEWLIVEVEMGHHSFNGHVKPQIDKLLSADYGLEEAEYLYEKHAQAGSLDKAKLMQLVMQSQPRVLVIVNQNKPDWAQHWKKNVVFASFELFRCSDDGNEIFWVNGEYPSIFTEQVSTCAFHRYITRIIRIDRPDALNVRSDRILRLLLNDCVTEWRWIEQGNEVYLTALNRNPLNAKNTYGIYRRNDGQLVLKKENI